MNRHELFQLFKSSFKNWLIDNASLRAGALTFFIILPLPSILLIVETVFSLFFGQAQANRLVIDQITSFAGPAVAQLFQALLSSSTSPFSSIWGSVTFVAFSLVGAIGAFAVLRDTMDIIWATKGKKKQSFVAMVRRRIGPFVVVSALGLIVIGWTAIAAALFKTLTHSIGSAVFFISMAQILSTFVLSVLLFSLTYKLIPDRMVHWRDVALPSLVAGLAFTITNYIIGTYVATFTVTTIIGAAGSLLIILLWIFIVNEIMLFGAEMSKVYAMMPGTHAKEHLSPEAEKIVRLIEEAGERLEEATKGDVEEETALILEQAAGEQDSKHAAEEPLKKEPATEQEASVTQPKHRQQLQFKNKKAPRDSPRYKANPTQPSKQAG